MTGARTPVPGESAYKPSNHRAGKAGCSRLNLWFCRVLFVARGPWGRPAPVFPAPSDLEGAILQDSDNLCRENVDAHSAVMPA